MLSKVKNVLKNSKVGKWVAASAVTAFCVVGSALTCFAADPSTPDLSTTVSTSFSTMQNELFTYINIVLPIALSIVGALFGIKYAINFFTHTAKKS